MKLKNYFLVLSIFLVSTIEISAQTMVPFTPRIPGGNVKIKGDIIYVGNSILGRTTTNPTFDASGNVTNLPLLTTQANTSYTGTANNNGINFEYIDVDGDATTFSSSRADLNIASPCKRIVYAGLYWTATYPYDRTRTGANYQEGNPTSTPRFNDWNQVKLSVPGGTYVDLIADNTADPVGDEDDIIFNGFNFYPGGNPNIAGTNSFKDAPYVCYKNVTNLISSLADANGTYTLANMRASRGARANGSCGGWTIVIVYESNNLSSKYISLFDGFAAIDTAFPPVDFNVNGFQTLPAPLPVRASVGAVTLEGDLGITGDSFRIKSNSVIPFTALSNTLNPVANFFNSSITNNNVSVLNRNPASTNTLGFDMDIVAVNNPLNAVIPNGETGATLRVTSSGDAYSTHIATFAVEIIEPVVVLTKTVQNSAGVDIGGGNVTLGQELNYVIGFQNIGNDNTNAFTIRDILPINITFNPADLILPPGVTYTYNAGTRELIFTIPNNLVEINDPRYEIRIRVFVVSQCNELSDACENRIQNQAFATYQGALNTQQITNDPSLSTFSICNNGSPSPTNFLAGVDDCIFTKTEVLCGASVTLTAASGYNTYSWSTSPTGTPVIGTGPTFNATATGTYYSFNTAIAPCLSIQEIYTVIPFVGGALTNPAIPVADQVVICGNDGKELPYIFLCGANDSQLITTSIAGALSIVWDRLNEGSCAASIANCANENPTCTWTQVGTGPNYLVNAPGQYRVTINFAGGCFRVFYFNSYQNLLAPTAVVRDIICTTPGQITVNNVPAGYEYSLSAAGPWQPSNVFPNAAYPVLAAGTYTVFIRQIGVANGCIFTVPDLSIRTRAFTATATVTQPLCNGNLGSVVLAANDVRPQYNFSVFNSSGTLVNSIGPIASNTHTFSNLNPGNYTYTVTSQDGCIGNGSFQIINPPVLTATAAITIPLTCTDGQITVYPSGGTAPYEYIVNAAPSVSDPNIPVLTAGIYNIRVVDNNNCFVDISINVPNNPPPVYTVSQTNVLCYGNNTGQIVFNMTNANGYTVEYSIDNGATYSANPTFSNLIAGTYNIIVRYTLAGSVCTTIPVVRTITEPAAALTASAGVSQLAGCGPAGEGEVRIINPQGGVPPYSYSFNNGASYGPANTAFLLPGTYTVYIRDANGCTYPMTVTIDPAPAAPTIVVSPAVFACTGNATSTVTVNNNGGNFNYTYWLDGVQNTPPNNNVFTNVPCGPRNVRVDYVATNIPTFSNLLFEDFGVGPNTTSPGIAAAYCFNNQPYPASSPCGNNVVGFSPSSCGTYTIEDNQYGVTRAIIPNNCNWFPYRDHTSNGTNPNGRFLAVNIGSAAGPFGILYSKVINNILPNQPVLIDLYLANLLNVGVNAADPDFILELVNSSGTVIASQATGIIDNLANGWQLRSVTLNPGANTTLTLNLRSGSILYNGNDAAIDDINVYQIPIACVTTRVFPINIDCNQAFAAQVTGATNVTCAGANNGTITIAAQNFGATGFEYSTNGGATWTTSTTSPVTISGLTNATYNIIIRYLPLNAACSFPFTQVISAPAALVTSATFTPATCLTGATITATAIGGTPAYQYQLTNSLGTEIVAYQNSPIFTNIPPGTYIVTTSDINLCTDPTDTTIVITAPTAPTAVIAAASDFCYDGTNAATLVVTASGGVAPYQYNINGGTFGSTNTFANLTPGVYTIIVRDAFGCTFTLPAQTINAQLLVSAVLTKDLDCTASPNAIITGTVTGGYPPYTVQVSFNANPFATSPLVISTPNAGTYQFQITDSRGCTALSNIITINPIVNPTATTTITNVTCNGLSNGGVTIVPSLGVPGYSISFNGSGFTSTTTYSGLAAGTYPYIVRDSKNCEFTGSVVITQPNAITGIATLTTNYTCSVSGAGNGVITVSGVTGGTSPYSYSIDGINFVPGNVFSGLANGSYTIIIRDANGCTFAVNTIVIAPLNPPTDMTFTSTALTCPSNNSNVTITTIGGTAAFTYQILLPVLGTPQASNVFNNLAPGTYTFQVTDSRNCSYQETFTISPLPPLTVNGNLVANVQCFGTNTGSASFVVTNSTGFTYTLNAVPQGAGVSPINLTNQPAGTYTVVVTDTATNCTATATVIISQPAVALSSTITVTPITCLANGQVVINAVGGWGGNQYTLTPPSGLPITQGSATFSNLSAIGLYTVTTTDSNGCVVSNTFTLTTPVAPTAVIAVASDYCYDTVNAATLVVTASGGVAPYEYSINTQPYQTSNTFPNLTPGVYTITVRDSFGCTFTLPAQTIQPQLNIVASLTKGLDCTASPNAVISGTVSGGYSPYAYQVSFNSGAFGASTPIVGTTFAFSTPTAGNYVFLITDARGCTVQSGIVTVAPLSLPLITSLTQGSQILCNGGLTASINVNINTAVGTAPYVINVLNTTTSVNYGTQTSGLPAGNYLVTITDANSCTDTEVITITQPAAILFTSGVVPITCTGSGTTFGEISVTGLTGGVGPFVYTLVSNAAPTQTHNAPLGANHTFTILNFGIYQLSVTDSNGCTLTLPNIIIASPPNDLDINVSTPTATCAAGGTAIVTVTPIVTGGPYTFGILTQPTPPYAAVFQAADAGFPLQATFTGLIPGVIYTFVVFDAATGCYYFEQAAAAIPPLSNLTSVINVVNNVTCAGNADANVNFTFSNYGGTSVTYQIFNAQTNTSVNAPITVTGLTGAPVVITNLGPLAPGNYYILFTENNGPFNGCTNASANFTVTQSVVALSISASVIRNDNCNPLAGQITAIGQGGTAPYTYQILPSASPIPTASTPGWVTSNTINADSGNYVAYVRDAFGCITSIPIALPLDPSPVIALAITNQCAATQGNYAINVTLTTPGIGPYTYSLDGGAFVTQTAPFTYTNLSSGAHTVQIRDFNGCGMTANITILAPISTSPVITALPTCANNDGVVTLTSTGGTGPFTYTIAPNPGVTILGNVISNIPSGTYTITATDTSNGCTRDVTVTLGAATPVTFTTSVNNVTCNGGTNGIITVNLPVSNNNPIYTYQIIAPFVGAVQNSNVFSGLAAQTYTILVSSGRGCSLSQNVTVGQPTVVVASASATAFTCAPNNSVNVAVITVTGVGGTPGYTYSINGINYFPTNTFNVVNNGAVQNFTVYVRDVNGCIDTEVISVNPLQQITSAAVTQTTAITCTNPEVVSITVVGGSGNYTYQLLPSGAAQGSNSFSLPAPGTYLFQVNDLTTGCTFATVPYTVAPFNTITAVASPVTPVTCFGDANGSININVAGYTGTYNYTVFSGAVPVQSGSGSTATNPLVITGLTAGNYTVQVTETASPFCVITSNVVTVGSPAAPVSLVLVSNVNANCNIGAQVTVNGIGGTPGYTYAFMQNGAIPVLADYGVSNTATLNPATNTQWDVYVRDIRGCFTFIDVTISTDALPTVTLPPFAANQCTSTGNSYTFTATGTGVGTLTYSIGAGFQPTGVFTVTAPGIYTVTIRDGNGCFATASITTYAPINSTPVVTALPTCANNDGVITMTTTGGVGPFTYAIAPPVGTIVGNVISNVPAGSYNITVTDTFTLCTRVVPVTLGVPTPVTFTTTVTPVTCNLGTDGIITVNLPASNDNPIYTYQITAGPVIRPTQNSNVFTGLPAGSYTILVTSGRACTATQTNIVIGQPALIVVPAATITQFGCTPPSNTNNLATIQVTGVTGGSGVYTNYQFILGATILQSGTSNTYSTANIAGGTYTINVFDANGCIGTTTAVINPFLSISAPTVTVNNPITCTTNEQITIGVTTTGGPAPVYSYTVDGFGTNPYLVTQASPVFTGLTIGDYLITVTNTVTGCSVQTIHYVFDPNTFDLTINNIVDVTCFGGSNGTANITIIDNDLTPTNDAGAFSYTIVNSSNVTVASGTNVSAGPLTVTGLPAGIYTANVTLTNNPFCLVSQNFTVNQPTAALAITATSTPITCIAGNNNGTITASATGGWGGPYEFQLMLGATQIVGYSTNPNFTGLVQGNYTVNVRDVRGCIVSINMPLVNPTPIAATVAASVSSVTCFGDTNASITITNVTGGQGSNYTYTLNTSVPTSSSGPVTNPVFSGLGAGTYTVTIRDGFNCEFTSGAIIIGQPALVRADVVLTTAQTCNNQSVLTLTGAGGTPPYSYSLDGVTYLPGTFNPSITINVPIGTHSYYIRDVNGCESFESNDITITPLVPLSLTLVSSDLIVECFGDANGSITVNATGGLGNYLYTLAGPVNIANQASGVFNNLPAGNYIVTVTSGDCTTAPLNITITQPSLALSAVPIVNNVLCNGGSTGSIVVNASGGTAPYRYAISPNLSQFFTTNTFNNLPQGNYTVLVQDNNGCFVQLNRSITEPAPLLASITAVTSETCANANDGSFTINNISGGTPPYTISYVVGSVNGTPVTLPLGDTSYTFNNLPGNVAVYQVSLTDANGCGIGFEANIVRGASFTAFPEVNYDCVNNAAANSVTINVTSSPAGQVALFSLDGGADTLNNVFTNLTPGLHSVDVQIDNCIKTVTFTIDAVAPLTVVANSGGLNQIVAVASGGSGNYVNYEFSLGGTVLQSGTSNIYIITQTGTYTIVVTDSNGCTATTTIYKEFIPIFIPEVFTPNGDGTNDGWGPENTENYKNIETIIHDRYGREIATLREGEKWFGKYNGNELPSGDYWYVIRIDGRNSDEYVGHFTLYR